MLNIAHVIERTKACTIAFMKPRNSLIYREEKNRWWKRIFFKALANRFWLTSKSCSWFNKAVHGRPSFKWTPWKVNDMLLKWIRYTVCEENSLGNGHWSTDEKRGAWSKLLMVFTVNFPFICYVGRICK